MAMESDRNKTLKIRMEKYIKEIYIFTFELLI